MKKQIFNLILLCFALPMCAQTPFQKSLSVYLDTMLIRSAPDGKSVYVVGSTTSSGRTDVNILRLDDGGNILWQREFIANSTTITVNSIETVRDGVLILVSDKTAPIRANCFLMKWNTDGSRAWSRQLGVSNRTNGIEIKKDGAENIWFAGEHLPLAIRDSSYSFLVQFNPNGVMLYNRKNMHHYFSNSADEIYKVTDLVWNSTISGLFMVEDFEAPYGASFISSANRGRYSLSSFRGVGREEEWFMDFQFERLVWTKTNFAAAGWTTRSGTFTRVEPAICLLDYTGREFNHIKVTKAVQRPIHSQSGDIVFYDPLEKTLTKYDTSMTAIWRKKFDNCVETTRFVADVAADGSIYTVRNLDNKTLVSHILSSGSLVVCADYDRSFAPLKAFENISFSGNVQISGFDNLPVLITDTVLKFNLKNTESRDFCFKLDASFTLLDTVCVGSNLQPNKIDTTSGLQHEWLIFGQWNSEIQPSITFPSVGQYRILHSLKNAFCSDSISRVVTVIAPPKIGLNDTIVCGAPKLTVNLTDKDARRYFLNGASTPPIFDINKDSIYAIRLENSACKTEKNVKIKIVDFPSPLKAVDSIYCFNTPFSAVLTGSFENIFWDNKPIKDTFIIRDAAKHSYRATYSLDKDCIVKGEFSILRKSCGGSVILDIVFIPNVFSPNGDNENDVFQAYPTKDAEVLSLMIYNRWGDLVFRSNDSIIGWNGLVNGALVAPDVYVYAVQYRDKRTDKVAVLSGSVTLLK